MNAILTFCEAGDAIVAASELYGGTFAQFKHSFKAMGITVTFVDVRDLAAIEAAIVDDTVKCVFVETISNPSYTIPDFEGISAICKKKEVPLVCDNTFGMAGYTCRPFKFGVDIIVESCTKWIGGHGTTIGGVLIDGCSFNWGVKKADGSPKFPRLSTACAAYHGMNFWVSENPTCQESTLSVGSILFFLSFTLVH